MEISEHIIKQLSTGSEDSRAAAFRVIFKFHFKSLLRFAIHLTQSPQTAEEIVQDAFLKTWQHRVFNDANHVKAYLYLTTRHMAINYLRRQKPNEKKALSVDFSASPDLTLLAQPDHAKGLIAEIDQELAHLSPAHQNIFHLTCVEGYNSKETGILLNMGAGTVRNKMVEIKRFLRGSKRILGASQIILSFLSFL
ncbi:RNA polymerase sigma factor [Pseudoflavitalea sp. X16]|uniref:RNA polymerase sigma factor n=1 Tax=Paraflavitalea devenefica TaxID=2716334 RepID=UPI0014224A2E|nr:RNA polymerase sigma factor [Paraflavitalea devenefica]NII26119.1 RNA polymerase sigma factor [Paraflavitalea devenefica]